MMYHDVDVPQSRREHAPEYVVEVFLEDDLIHMHGTRGVATDRPARRAVADRRGDDELALFCEFIQQSLNVGGLPFEVRAPGAKLSKEKALEILLEKLETNDGKYVPPNP